ncbi:hypothetical protein N2152v2_010742 [Parachlorella kessleri]
MATVQQYQPVAATPEKPRGVGAKLKSVLSGLTGNKTFTGIEELPAAPTHQLPAPSRPPAGLQSPLVPEGAEIRSEGPAIVSSEPGIMQPATPQHGGPLHARPVMLAQGPTTHTATVESAPQLPISSLAQPTTLGVRPGRIEQGPTVAAAMPGPPLAVSGGPGVVLSPVGAIAVPQAQTIGVRPGRIAEGSAAAAVAGGVREEGPPSPVQGDRVKVQRLGGARAGGIPEVSVRPAHETMPISAEEVAALKEREHQMRLSETRSRSLAKQRDMIELKKQAGIGGHIGKAELLEVESQGLLAQASQEKMKVDKQLEKKHKFEQREWSNLAQAEAAERQRREVVREVAPIAQSAEEREVEALKLRRLAEDTNYHAEVLEAKAKALLMESTQMAQLARSKLAEAEELAARHVVAQQELQEVRGRLREITTGDLPTYIEECMAEMGRLQHRITELRSEVEWAHNQLEATHYEGLTWERLVLIKQATVGQLKVGMVEARRTAELAQQRSREAAEEAREPTSLAEVKYEEAYRLSQEAEVVAHEAAQLQEYALEVEAPAEEAALLRQEKLREAGEAEAAAKAVEARAVMQAERVEARLHEAEVKATTALELAQQAEVAEGEVARTQRLVQQEAQLAEAYGAQRERHAAGPNLLAVAT